MNQRLTRSMAWTKRRSKQKHRVKGQDVVVAELMAQGDDADQRLRRPVDHRSDIDLGKKVRLLGKDGSCAKDAERHQLMVVTMCEA